MSITDIIEDINSVQNFINNNTPLTPNQMDQYKSDGFILPATYSADSNGLPYSKTPNFRSGILNRNIISWFVPEFGVIKMYVNPSSITYNHKKIITKDRTKGGFTLQYWGEDLDTLNISGTTGGAGVEGINVLEEIYRAEQYAFDTAGMLIASQNNSTNLSNSLADLGEGIGGNIGGIVGGAIGSTLGLDDLSNGFNNINNNNVPTLAQLAFTVEMYYGGWVFRGFFESMNVTERADNFLWDYQITFTVTQRRGYRTNYFPWSKSASNGPSQYNSPHSFSGNVITGL